MPDLVLRPERMTRIAVIAPKAHQAQVIETLHDAKLAHLEEYTEGKAEGLDIGEPLPEASSASELLVRLRAIISTCKLEGPPDRPLTVPDILDRLETQLPELEAEVNEVTDERDRLQRELDTVNERIGQLQPLTDLPLRLEDYRGYETLRVLIGTAPRPLEETLSQAIERFEYFAGAHAHAVFIHQDEAERAQEILATAGFRELEIPEGEGSIAENLGGLRARRQELKAKTEATKDRLVQIAQHHGDFLLAAEEHLSIKVEKAEAPLGFGATERTFLVDAWVPAYDVERLQNAIEETTGGCVHFEVIDKGDRDGHHREDEPPTKYDHPAGVQRFGFLLDLFSPPKYDELDPTIILFLVFPFFFGFMIGDLGYGVLMVALGYFLYKRVGAKSEAAASLGYALLLSGIWSALFGGLVFHDVLGIPYVPHSEGELAWFTFHGEAGLLAIELSDHSWAAHAMLEKLGDDGVKAMLALSILAAFVHLFVGFIFAFINHLGHNTKHALAQIGWMAVLAGLAVLAIVEGPENEVSHWLLGLLGEPNVATAGFVLAPGLLLLILTEGSMGVMETFGLFSNMISYTRLAGVAVAKGAMASAFNFVFLQQMTLEGTGLAIAVVGFVLFILAQLVVFVLGMISSAIQGIRLNYVEFFLKFYEGGGEPFTPFGRERQYTTDNEPN